MAQLIVSSTIIPFSVSGISKLTTGFSPEVSLHGIPFKIKVAKCQQSLGVYLHCSNTDTHSNWTTAACATIKLLPISADQPIIERYLAPHVFRRFSCICGINTFIQWNDLVNKYVKGDTIQLEAKIEAEDPNGMNRSALDFNICNFSNEATLQLTVRNVANLMAVQSPVFIVCGMPWYIAVRKDGTHLGVVLISDSRSKQASCRVKMCVKLVSSKGSANSIEKTVRKTIKWPTVLNLSKMASWAQMLKPENGFVDGNSITLKVEIKSDEGGANIPDVNQNNVVQYAIVLLN